MDFVSKAIVKSKEAVQADDANDHAIALRLYMQAIDYFMMAIKHEKIPALAVQLKQALEPYLRRAETLKSMTGHRAVAESRSGSSAVSKRNANDNHEFAATINDTILSNKPNVQWDDIVGLHRAKMTLKEAVVTPVRLKHLFVDQCKPWGGILLYGPPGTGKSFLAKAVATEVNATFFSVASADIVSKWQGDSERYIKSLFKRAREESPAVLFIDEIDSLCSARNENESESARRIKTQFLVEMDGVGAATTGIVVLAATNTPWLLDPAIKRRFEKRIYIPLPDAEARYTMFSKSVAVSDADIPELVSKTQGYSGADISIIMREASMMPIRELTSAMHFRKEGDLYYPDETGVEATWDTLPPETLRTNSVRADHIFMALGNVKPSVDGQDLDKYEQFTEQSGQMG